MPRLGWHKRVEESLEEVGKDWEYEILRPRVIHFHHHNYYQLRARAWKEDTTFGSELEEDVEIPLHSKTRRNMTYRKEERFLIRPNVRAFFLIVEEYEEDFQRYIDTIQEIVGVHRDAKVFSLARGLYKSQMIQRLKSFKLLRQKYKP